MENLYFKTHKNLNVLRIYENLEFMYKKIEIVVLSIRCRNVSFSQFKTKQKPHPEVCYSCLLNHIIKLILWLAAIIIIEISRLRPQRGPFDYLKRN